MDDLNEDIERRRNNFNNDHSSCDVEVIKIDGSDSFLKEKNDFIENWLLNAKKIQNYRENRLDKSTNLIASNSINVENDNDDDDDYNHEIKIINRSSNRTHSISSSTNSSVSAGILYEKKTILKINHNNNNSHDADDDDNDDEDDDDDDDDDVFTKATNDLIENIDDCIELGRRFTCSTPKPAINLSKMFSFIEVEVSTMNDNVSIQSGCLDIDLETIELSVLKEIDSFNENKSIDFNFKLKLPTNSLNHKKIKKKSNDLLKNLLIKNQLKLLSSQQRRRINLSNNDANNRVKGFNLLKEFLITKYQIH